MDLKILVADDDPVFRELVCDIVRKEGYTPLEAIDGQDTLDVFFGNKEISMIILDVMMPKYDGWTVLKEIREHSEVPVIMLTALGDEKHEIQGLRKGADDYIAKPFSYEVFVARLNAVLRKVKKDITTEILCGEILIQQSSRKVFIEEREIGLNRKEFELLQYFAQNQGRVLTREQILAQVWGYDFEGDIRTIDTHIKTLRAKLDPWGSYLKTIRGTGYIFEVCNHEN